MMDHFIVNYFNQICKSCNRKESCLEPCQEYLDYLDQIPNNENNKRDIHTIKIDHLTPEKKEELMNLIKQYSGRLEVSDMDFGDVNVEYDDDNDISNFLEYDVSDPLWLQVCNNQISYKELLNKSALLSYLQKCNERYCSDNGLCRICRNLLVEIEEDRGEHFGTSCSEKILVCQYGCE